MRRTRKARRTPGIPGHLTAMIEGELESYPSNLRRAEYLREEVIGRAPDIRTGVPVRTSGSDPTSAAAAAIDNEEELRFLEKRIGVIDRGMEVLPDRVTRLVRFRYFRGMDSQETADRLGVTIRHFYRLRNVAIRVFLRQFGLL